MEMQLDTKYFDAIMSGEKEYEIRIYDEKRRRIKYLDRIKFIDRGDSSRTFEAMIIELIYFQSFADALRGFDFKRVLPNAKTLKECLDIYENFPHECGNYKKGAEQYGVLRMKFSLV